MKSVGIVQKEIKKGVVKLMGKKLLEINDLYVNAKSKEILKGINLNIERGQIHVIMGPNGSRKNYYSKCYFK